MWLMNAICFVLPMKASFIYILSAFLLLVWIWEGSFLEKFKNIFSSRLCWLFVAYFFVFVLGMLWTQNVGSGWAMVKRQIPILLFLLYWSCSESKFRERYILAFIAGLFFCAILANYNLLQLHWFSEWPRGIRVDKSVDDTAPFVDRIFYAPILALGAYFSLSRIFYTKGWARGIAIAASLLLVFNLSFSGGRAGMVMFAALAIALIFERTKKFFRAAIFCLVVMPLIFCIAYKTQDYFAQRVDHAVSDLRVFKENPETSIGLRLVYWTTSFHVYLQHPLFGVGSGDFQSEYALEKPEKWASTPDSYNPHNQFLMTAVTTGSLGLFILLSLFVTAVKSSCDTRMRVVIIGFMVVCIFESYLWRSNTALTFSVLVAILAIKKNEIEVS